MIEDLHSEKYTLAFLNNITLLFKGLKLTMVNEVYYLNRLDFQYNSDLQRTTPDAPILYNCAHCKTEYLARVRIGFPQAPEKPMPQGTTGKICIDEIIQIEATGARNFATVLKESRL
jgi:hypothetical protein